MKKVLKLGLAVLATLFLLAQFVPVDRANPPVETEIDAPPEVLALLGRSCYDCHSHQTRWPWYSRVAPVSWLVVRDVEEGREHLNFSTWNRYSPKERSHKIEEIWEEVEKGEMPLWFYLPLHPEARLSDGDLATLRPWSEAEGGKGGEGGKESQEDDHRDSEHRDGGRRDEEHREEEHERGGRRLND